MVNISQLRKDLKGELTLEEVCIKHNISFGEMVEIMARNQPRKPKNKSRKYHSTGERYISYYDKRYMLRRRINGKFRSFGGYETLEDAIKMRDYLDEHGWHSRRVPAIRKRLGV